MESRGDNADEQATGRPMIARRSCDQCRARKVGCDRGSPCSNCVSAKLNCTHSAVASKGTTPKQRVLISAQYEQKIDGIARGIDGITLLLQGLNEPPDARRPQLYQARSMRPLIDHQPVSESGDETPSWDDSHSAHIVDFVKAVVEDRGLKDVSPESNELLLSLRNLVQTLESPSAVLCCPETKYAKGEAHPLMPPLEAAVAVLRWAKDHTGYIIISLISRMLPLEKFTEVCQKVYFAVDDYSEIDLILANGYLYYMFSQYVIVSGLQDYREYCLLCQENFHSAVSRLPLLLPASMEVIAALTLGAFNAIENCKATMAWTFISSASNLCQTLGYHRLSSLREEDQTLRASQKRLFWTVYKIDKSVSLRLGRSSNIHDAEITLPLGEDEPRQTRLGRIQGKVYDQLYSPVGLFRGDDERGYMAEALARELRELINETHVEVFEVTSQGQSSNCEEDPMRLVYLQCDLVCQSSLLALILRAIPSLNGVSDDCVAVARETLDIHQQCMIAVRDCKSDPFMVTKYINWAILHTPFVPFSILFTRSVQLLDHADLARLDRFAASLLPSTASPPADPTAPESMTHPYRLYQLLYQAARLYIDSNITDLNLGLTQIRDVEDDFDFEQFGVGMETENRVGVGSLELEASDGMQGYGSGLSEWYRGNQQIMNLLDEDVMF